MDNVTAENRANLQEVAREYVNSSSAEIDEICAELKQGRGDDMPGIGRTSSRQVHHACAAGSARGYGPPSSLQSSHRSAARAQAGPPKVTSFPRKRESGLSGRGPPPFGKRRASFARR
jgi:hypothetical protein